MTDEEGEGIGAVISPHQKEGTNKAKMPRCYYRQVLSSIKCCFFQTCFSLRIRKEPHINGLAVSCPIIILKFTNKYTASARTSIGLIF